MRSMHLFVAVLLALPIAAVPSRAPEFRHFPTPIASGISIAAPRLQTREERRYTAVLQNAVAKGYGVVRGGSEEERPGINFAGRYLLVQWSCGVACREAAIIDAIDGTVLRLPSVSGRQSLDFRVPTFTATTDLRDLRFRADSTLLGIPNQAGTTSFFLLKGHAWKALGN